jgi:hypothetical protein
MIERIGVRGHTCLQEMIDATTAGTHGSKANRNCGSGPPTFILVGSRRQMIQCHHPKREQRRMP